MGSAARTFLFISTAFLIMFCGNAQAQFGSVKGVLTDENGSSVPFANIVIDSLSKGTVSSENGSYHLQQVPAGVHNIRTSVLGYEDQIQRISIGKNSTVKLNFKLKVGSERIDEVVIKGKTTAENQKEQAYAVEVIEVRSIQSRDVNMNQITSQMAGIRVRESGGMGSNFSYSLNGMSGRSVRFFVDGIPMDRYGSGYGINNFPVNLINRVEIYKGVVPPELGSDALGGVINLVTKNSLEDYLDVSYSFGSFNTHRAAISSRWIHDSTKFFIDAQGYFNYSDNNYFVWGPGVEVANPTTGRAEEIKTRRFHDAYRSGSGKLDLGFMDKSWADMIKLGFLYANNHNEIQHGATMAAVIGEATRSETSYTPNIYYSKKDLFTRGLDLKLFNSVSWLISETVDTSSRVYDWQGQVIDEQPTSSEMGRGQNGKSLLTMTTINQFHQANIGYRFKRPHRINLNYTYDGSIRDGKDPLFGDRTAGFKEPQRLTKQVTSLAYEAKFFKEVLTSTVWVKNYDFRASTVDEQYVTDTSGYNLVTFPIESGTNNFGFGAAFKADFKKLGIVKLSVERSFRIPDVDEMLGDGLFVRISPELQPEESVNLNVGWLIKDIRIGSSHFISLEPNVFYRNTYNLILYQVQQNRGTGQYFNVGKVQGVGGTFDFNYRFREMIRFNANVTYQDLRDWNEFDGDNPNQTYQDRLPNTPYLMANGGVTFAKKDLVWKRDELSVYWNLQYVNEFFLNWPSLGNPNTKAVIPTQLINSVGLSYAMLNGRYSISFSCNNIFNEQVYDNYLLQKPGRSFSVKFRVHLSKSNQSS